jgi:hypothetical protein
MIPARLSPMAGPVEEWIRNRLKPGKKLSTPTKRAPFKLSAYGESGIVLMIGERGARATLSWACLEAVPRFLVGRGWVPLSGSFDPQTSTGTLETHLLAFGSTATPGALAALLVAADIIELESARPVRARLSPQAADLATASPNTGEISAGTRRMQEREYRPNPRS